MEQDLFHKPLPKNSPTSKPLIICQLAIMIHSLIQSSFFPYLAFLVVEVGQAKNVNLSGQQSGVLGASMFFGRLVTLLPWGSLVDKYNKKKILYISMFMMSIWTLIFGFVLQYPILLVLRFLTGVCNPLPVVIKPYISYLIGSGNDRNNERKTALGQYTNFNSFGLIIGNIIGGTFARPYNTQIFGVISTNSILHKYPFLLPNLIIGIFGIILATIVIIFLPNIINIRKKDEGKSSYRAIIFNKDYFPIFLIFTFIGFITVSVTEVQPLYKQASYNLGGLGLTQSQATQTLTIGLIFIVVFSLLQTKFLVGRFNSMSQFKINSIILIIVLLLTPMQRLVQVKGNYIMDIIIPAILFSLPSSLTFLISNSGELWSQNMVHPEHRGKSTAVRQIYASISSSTCPIISTNIFAYSITNKNADITFNEILKQFPLNYFLFFQVCVIFSGLLLITGMFFIDEKYEFERKKTAEIEIEMKFINMESFN